MAFKDSASQYQQNIAYNSDSGKKWNKDYFKKQLLSNLDTTSQYSNQVEKNNIENAQRKQYLDSLPSIVNTPLTATKTDTKKKGSSGFGSFKDLGKSLLGGAASVEKFGLALTRQTNPMLNITSRIDATKKPYEAVKNLLDTTEKKNKVDTSNMNLGGKAINFVGNQAPSLAAYALLPETGLTAKIGSKLEPLATNAVKKYGVDLASKSLASGIEFGGLSGGQTAIQGGKPKEILNSTKEGAITGALFGGGSKVVGDVAKSAFPKWNTVLNETQPIVNPNNVLKTPQKAASEVNPVVDRNAPVKANTVELRTASDVLPSVGATDRTKSLSQIVSSEKASKFSPREAWDKFYINTVDSNHGLKKVDLDTYKLATNSKKVGGTVNHIYQNALVDRQGNKIGESLKDIGKDIPKNKESDFFNYVLQKHNIDRAGEGKPVYTDFTPEESLRASKIIETQHPEFKELGNRLTKFVNNFESEWGNKSGLISDDLWKSLQDTYKNYVPTNRSFTELEGGVGKTNGKGFVNQTTPLSKAVGSERDIINPVENIMNLVDRTVRTSRYNEVGQELLKKVESNPSAFKKYAEIVPKETEINPSVNNIVSVLVKGEPVNLRINDKNLLETLQGLTKPDVGKVGQTIRKYATTPFKSMITTKNPLFAIKNTARDIPTAYINGSEKNPVKYFGDLFKAGKEIATNSENFQRYQGVGGESANFLNSNKTFKGANELMNRKLKTDDMGQIIGSENLNPIVRGLKGIDRGVEKLNSFTETAPRLAEFNRTLKKTGNIQDALYNAGEVTTNFSRGGGLTKKVDSVAPYLNASVQGFDKTARQLKSNPIGTLAKGAAMITVPTLAINKLNENNPNYKALDNRTKDNFFMFPNPADGGKTFIKLPKSREFGVLFGSLAERTIRAKNGEKEAFKGFGTTGGITGIAKGTVATNFAPSNPLENNLYTPISSLKSNKDFANRAIVPQSMITDNRSKNLQFDESTSEISKLLAREAKKVGVDLSPKQTDYIIKSYTGVLGQFGLPLATKSNDNSSSSVALSPLTRQFTADSLYSNQGLNDFYENLNNAKRKASDNNILNDIDSKSHTPEEKTVSYLNKINKNISDLSKEATLLARQGKIKEAKEKRQQIIDLAKDGNDLYNSR